MHINPSRRHEKSLSVYVFSRLTDISAYGNNTIAFYPDVADFTR
jgi:hypothetical protein